MNGPTQVDSLWVDMHTLEENIVSKVRSEVDNVLTTVETRVEDAVLTAIENLVIPRMELAIKSANAFSGLSVDDNELEPDKKDFSGNIKSLQMTAWSKIDSHTELNRFDETRGNMTVEGEDLLVNERNIDRQTHTHHGDTCNKTRRLIRTDCWPTTTIRKREEEMISAFIWKQTSASHRSVNYNNRTLKYVRVWSHFTLHDRHKILFDRCHFRANEDRVTSHTSFKLWCKKFTPAHREALLKAKPASVILKSNCNN